MNIKKPFFVVIAIFVVFGLGGFFYFNARNNSLNSRDNEIKIIQREAKNEEVDSIKGVVGENRLVYSERIVKAIDEKGENIYETKFYLTDSQGEKRYNFYTAEDLTYESAYPYQKDKLLILKEFGRVGPRLINLEGEILDDEFVPEVDFGTDFCISDDNKIVAYLKANSNSGFDYLIKIKNLETGEEKEFNPEEIKHNDINFSQFIPLAFSKDNNVLYVFASQYGLDLSYQNPNGLYAINLKEEKIEEIYYSSLDDSGVDNLLVLLGVFPKYNIALVNRGPQKSEGDKTIFRTQIQKIDLSTKKFTDLYLDENNDRVGNGGKILSPDGKKLILLNDAYYDRGLSLYNLENKKETKLLDSGEFITWLNDNKTIIYRLYQTEEKEGNLRQRIELHSLNVETGEDYKIYSGEEISEGAGLNKVGDKFYNFIGEF